MPDLTWLIRNHIVTRFKNPKNKEIRVVKTLG